MQVNCFTYPPFSFDSKYKRATVSLICTLWFTYSVLSNVPHNPDCKIKLRSWSGLNIFQSLPKIQRHVSLVGTSQLTYILSRPSWNPGVFAILNYKGWRRQSIRTSSFVDLETQCCAYLSLVPLTGLSELFSLELCLLFCMCQFLPVCMYVSVQSCFWG